MPVNPMQRRIRNSFLLGFLVSLIIMAILVVFLMFKMKSMQNEKTEMEGQQQSVYVAMDNLDSGAPIKIEALDIKNINTTVNPLELVTADDFTTYNNDGSENPKNLIAKINIPAGTILTKSMVIESKEEIADDVRLQEYNMILLPTELETGDYIDIRYSLPQGQNYIVLAKKKVEKATETTIWMKMSEEEIVTLNNAIVESYQIPGSMLSAVEYAEPGLQKAATPTYPVSPNVLESIRVNPNIIEQAKQNLYARYYNNESAVWNQRVNVLDPIVAANSANMGENIEAKNQEEFEKIQSSRADYLGSSEEE